MKTIITDIPSREEFTAGKIWRLGYPWLTYGAIIALEYLVNKDFKVLEFGSGGSTVFWGQRCQSVKSFETDSRWVGRVQRRTAGMPNVEVVYATETEMLTAIKKEPDNYYDLIMVDNHPKHANRLALTNAVIPKLKINGWFIVDNYMKHGMNTFNPPMWDVLTFDEINYDGRGTKLCRKVQ